jgi:translation initiation factor IF-2
MVGLLSPKEQENVIGHAQVREVFRVSKVGTIAGCMVTDGMVRRSAKVRVIRDGIVLHDGKLSGLKRMKDDAKEVKEGFECGISIEKFDDIRKGDQIECYEIQQVAATLASMEAAREPAPKDRG